MVDVRWEGKLDLRFLRMSLDGWMDSWIIGNVESGGGERERERDRARNGLGSFHPPLADWSRRAEWK